MGEQNGKQITIETYDPTNHTSVSIIIVQYSSRYTNIIYRLFIIVHIHSEWTMTEMIY
jgi:hypothetical protein